MTICHISRIFKILNFRVFRPLFFMWCPDCIRRKQAS